MEKNESEHASPQKSELDRNAFDTPIHPIRNDLKRKHMTTTPVNNTIEDHEFNGTHQRWTEPLPKKHKIDHAVQQEAEEEEIREAPLSLSTFSLAHQGRFSRRSGIPFFTAEMDHDATLTAITREEDGVFVCRINIWIKGTDESCIGLCSVPIAEMDTDVAKYYRKRPEWMEDVELNPVSGKVRLGRVAGEDHSPGTYTCQAEFGDFEAVNPWEAEVYVPKKHVPDYKLVDWEGEQNAVASIEISGKESEMNEQEPARRHTVEFSRYIETDRKQMSVTFWSADGEYHCVRSEAQILAFEDDGPQIYLEFRLRQCEESWWHFNGRMDRGLTHGRFDISSSPVPNIESNAHFGMGWMDQSIESDTARKIRELRERIQSNRVDSKEQCLERQRAVSSPCNSEGGLEEER